MNSITNKEFLSIGADEDADFIFEKLKKKYGASNMRPQSQPVTVLSYAKILEVRVVNKNLILRIDGPGFLVDEIYRKIISNR